ncbi:MAG: class I SAM-dependent methyltransferase, partial [Bacillota bacterium]
MKDFNLMQGVEYSHWILKNILEEGDVVIDATVGNGHDTLFLANLVGKNGLVYGFDIQEKAINNAKKRLKDNGVIDRVQLKLKSHENLDKYIESDKVSAILFNLGYLPGSDKNIITKSETTINAIKSSLKVLKLGGLVVLVMYPGHKGGKDEKEEILKFSKDLDKKKYNILHYY